MGAMDDEVWALWAHEKRMPDGEVVYHHAGSKHFVELHGMDMPIVAVDVRARREGDAGRVYHGWISTRDGRLGLIFPTEVQFRMCFPYGFEVAEKAGHGRHVRLSITPRLDAA